MHSTIGPSSFLRVLRCPGSVHFDNLDLPPQNSVSVAAEEGVRLHELSEKIIQRYADENYDLSDLEFKLGDAEVILPYVLYCQTLLWKCQQWGIETKIKVKLDPDRLFGTSDFWAMIGETLYVVDFKSGSKRISQEGQDAQLNYYALGLIDTMELDPKFIKTVIIQPKTNKKPKMTQWRREEFDEWVDMIFVPTYTRLTSRTEDELVEGDHCFFCPARLICPVKNKEKSDMVSEWLEKGGLDEPEEQASEVEGCDGVSSVEGTCTVRPEQQTDVFSTVSPLSSGKRRTD